MITDLPIYVYITFSIAIIFALVQFYYASNKNKIVIIGIISWGIFHSLLAVSGFYDNTKTIPPRFILLVIPMIMIVISTILSKKMKNWLNTFDLKKLTFLHTVRIPVELVLYWLFIGNYAPELITFEGRNFDVLAGITAPLIVLITFKRDKINKPLLLIWNIFSIILLTNILVRAVLSTPTILQQFAFEQPNIAVMKFPFLLLPAVIVPIVLISNMAGFVILTRKK